MRERTLNRKPIENAVPYEGQVYSDTDRGNSYRVDFLIKLCELGKLGPVTDLRLNDLLVDGRIEGDSDEPDDHEQFFSRVQGLTLEKYQQGQYSPILVGKANGEYYIVDGRHRAVHLLALIKKNALDTDGFTMKSYIIDFDNPAQKKIVEKAKLKN